MSVVEVGHTDADPEVRGAELRELGAERARHIFHEAIYQLWLHREAAGMRKKDIAHLLECSPSQITRWLMGPANWSIDTVGALAEALDGQLEVRCIAREDIRHTDNFDIYADILHGHPHNTCPITDYRPTYKGKSKPLLFGSTVTVTTTTSTSGVNASNVKTREVK